MSNDLAANFVKRFGRDVTIEGNLCQPAEGFSVTAVFGPSGCGKTTTLRCLAGLERPEIGRISHGSTVWFDAERRIFLTPQQRDIGYLFQEYALFPHLSVARNIAFGLQELSRIERQKRVAEMLVRFNLVGLENRCPQQISGGEQQRVALARVLVRRPRLLLLDEPLSALDQPTREQLRPELRGMLAQFGIPVILVTHDQNEVMALADQLLVLDRGKVRQQGPVADVFNRPADVEVARIVGMTNVHPGRIEESVDGLCRVRLGQALLFSTAPAPATAEVFISIRPEDIALQRGTPEQASVRNRLPGVVTLLTPEGALTRVSLDCGFPLVALVSRAAACEMDLREKDEITAVVKATSVHLVART